MKTEHLAYLLTVWECGSITKASKKLYLSQQKLSRTIQMIEEELGFCLFERKSKGVTPTLEGTEFLKLAEIFLTQTQLLKQKYQHALTAQSLNGTLSLHAPNNIWGEKYSRIIQEFSHLYPRIKIQLDEIDYHDILDALHNNPPQIAIGLSISDAAHQQDVYIADDVRFIPMYEVKPVVYARSDSYFAQTYKTTSFQNLLTEPLVVYSSGSHTDYASIGRMFAPHGTPNIKYEVSNLQTYYDLLKAGDCIAIGAIPQNAPRLREGLTIIPIRSKSLYQIGAIVSKNRPLDAIEEAFLQFYYQTYHEL